MSDRAEILSKLDALTAKQSNLEKQLKVQGEKTQKARLALQVAEASPEQNKVDMGIVKAWCPKYGITAEMIEKDINARGENQKTLLIAAIDDNDGGEVAKALIRLGADVNLKNNKEKTALIKAASNERKEIVGALLAVPGIDINARDNEGKTALMQAVLRENVNIVNILVAKGADVNIKNNTGDTVIDIANKIKDDDMKAMIIAAIKPSPPQPNPITLPVAPLVDQGDNVSGSPYENREDEFISPTRTIVLRRDINTPDFLSELKDEDYQKTTGEVKEQLPPPMVAAAPIAAAPIAAAPVTAVSKNPDISQKIRNFAGTFAPSKTPIMFCFPLSKGYNDQAQDGETFIINGKNQLKSGEPGILRLKDYLERFGTDENVKRTIVKYWSISAVGKTPISKISKDGFTLGADAFRVPCDSSDKSILKTGFTNYKVFLTGMAGDKTDEQLHFKEQLRLVDLYLKALDETPPSQPCVEGHELIPKGPYSGAADTYYSVLPKVFYVLYQHAKKDTTSTPLNTQAIFKDYATLNQSSEQLLDVIKKDTDVISDTFEPVPVSVLRLLNLISDKFPNIYRMKMQGVGPSNKCPEHEDCPKCEEHPEQACEECKVCEECEECPSGPFPAVDNQLDDVIGKIFDDGDGSKKSNILDAFNKASDLYAERKHEGAVEEIKKGLGMIVENMEAKMAESQKGAAEAIEKAKAEVEKVAGSTSKANSDAILAARKSAAECDAKLIDTDAKLKEQELAKTQAEEQLAAVQADAARQIAEVEARAAKDLAAAQAATLAAAKGDSKAAIDAVNATAAAATQRAAAAEADAAAATQRAAVAEADAAAARQRASVAEADAAEAKRIVVTALRSLIGIEGDNLPPITGRKIVSDKINEIKASSQQDDKTLYDNHKRKMQDVIQGLITYIYNFKTLYDDWKSVIERNITIMQKQQSNLQRERAYTARLRSEGQRVDTTPEPVINEDIDIKEPIEMERPAAEGPPIQKELMRILKDNLLFRKDGSLYDPYNDNVQNIINNIDASKQRSKYMKGGVNDVYPDWIPQDKLEAIKESQRDFCKEYSEDTGYKGFQDAYGAKYASGKPITDKAGNKLYKMPWNGSTRVSTGLLSRGLTKGRGAAQRGGSKDDVRYSPHSIREFAEEQAAWEKANDAYNEVPENYREKLPGPGPAPALEFVEIFKRYIDENAEEDPINDAREAVGMLSHEDLDEIMNNDSMTSEDDDKLEYIKQQYKEALPNISDKWLPVVIKADITAMFL